MTTVTKYTAAGAMIGATLFAIVGSNIGIAAGGSGIAGTFPFMFIGILAGGWMGRK